MFEVYAQDYRITIQEIPLGNQGEDMARCLVIDITDAVNEFGSGGTVSVRNKRNGDELPYFCTNVSTVTGADAEGNVHTYIKWTLTDVDTAAAGSGFVQADYIISGTTVKTWVYKYFILPSLGITGDVPDPYEDILEEIEAQVSAVQTAAASAAASAAQASAEATRIISTTQQVVEDWLSDHIVTGYTVDDTLTISGAAADSATVGTQLRAAFVTEQTSGSIASFADGADGVPVKDLVVNISPVQSGTGDPSPSNVRAISGWTGAKIGRTGKNMIDVSQFATLYPNLCSYSDGVLTVTAESVLWRTGITIDAPAGAVLTYDALTNITSTSARVRIAYEDGTAVDVNVPYTLTKRAVALRFNWSTAGQFTISGLRIGVAGATFTEFVASDTYEVSFGSAGTVYGGTLDVTTGMLTVTHKAIDLGNVDVFYSEADSGRFRIADSVTSDMMASPNRTLTILCSCYKPNIGGGAFADLTIYNSASKIIYIVDASYANNLSGFKASLTGQTAVYPLAQPVSYQLTPTEVKSLLGINNIWADTGSVASCEYRADTKLYLEKLTTPDDDMVANANITSGSYFMVGNSLYLAAALNAINS